MSVEQLTLPRDRAARLQYVREAFPECGGADATMIGGRTQARLALARANVQDYARTRNHLRGDVTRLSPYFRHGMLSLREAADDAILRVKDNAYKFVFELAWRDFWRRVWRERGDGIREAIEMPKVALGEAKLPDDIRTGSTGLRCMDSFVRDLVDEGYVHNHARMWFASYVVHHRKIDWREAADWYYAELLDGDWASNHLSWQWVGSTFSAKPYFFNKENLVRYTDGALCKGCKAQCPFDETYENLERSLFKAPDFTPQVSTPITIQPPPKTTDVGVGAALLVHDEMLGGHLPIYENNVAQQVFVFDPQWMQAENWSLKRVQFVCDGLAELPDVKILKGSITSAVGDLKILKLHTQSTPNPHTHALLARAAIPVTAEDEPTFARYDGKLTRFMQYWGKIERQFFPNAMIRS